MPGVRPNALLYKQLFELPVKGLSVIIFSEYTEGSDCSIHRDTMQLRGGPGLCQDVFSLDKVGQAPLRSLLQYLCQDKYGLELKS